MEKWGSGELGKWGNGEVGKWGSGEVKKWRIGEMGKWGTFVTLGQLSIVTMDDPVCASAGHKVLDDAQRQVSSSILGARPGGNDLCDGYLKEDWYRFEVNGQPVDAASQCPDVFSCGTKEPVWIAMPKRPLIGEQIVTDGCRTIEFRGRKICCAWKLEVVIKNCGDFLVYRLGPTGFCPSAYCVKDTDELLLKSKTLKTDVSALSRNSILDNNFQDVVLDLNIEESPNVTRQPRIQARGGAQNSVVFGCAFQSSASRPEKAQFRVNWFRPVTFFGGKFGRISIFSETVSRSPSLFQVKLGEDLPLGVTIYCDVQPYYEGAAEKGNATLSEGFYVGIKAVPDRLVIGEDEQMHKIQFTSTVPIFCKDGGNDCYISIPLYLSVDNPDPKKLATLRSDIALSACEVRVKRKACDVNGCGDGTLDLTAVTDFIEDGDRATRIVTARVRALKAVGWKAYDPPDIQVHVKDIETNRCSVILSGIVLRLNGKKTIVSQRGSFKLYKSLSRVFEVHTRFWPCPNLPQGSCACGFVVKENFDVISVDMCDGEPGKTAVQISILSGAFLSRGVQIAKANQGKRFSVYFPSGAFVRADVFEWGMNIFLQSPSVDTGNVEGLCTGKNPQFYKGTVKNARLGDLNNLFTMPAVQGIPRKQNFMCACSINDVVKAFRVCNNTQSDACKNAYSCLRNDRISVPVLSFEMDITDIVLSNMLLGFQSRLYIFPWDDINLLRTEGEETLLIAPQPKANVGTKEECFTKLSTILFAVLCRESLKLDLNKIQSFCNDALKLTPEEPAVTLFGLLESNCEERVIKNASTWVTISGGQIVPSLTIQRHLCPNLCSGHGTCSNGVCYCNRGYTSSDCSIPVAQAPKVYAVLPSSDCDLVYNDCSKAVITGNGFMESHQLTCSVIPMFLVKRVWQVQQKRTSNAAMFDSYRSVSCAIPRPAMPKNINKDDVVAYGYQISVTNDQRKLSDFLSVIVYNGTCLTCGRDQQRKCDVKDGFCLIKGLCRNDGEMNPDDPCKVCRPHVNKYGWSANRVEFVILNLNNQMQVNSFLRDQFSLRTVLQEMAKPEKR
eukprot:gene6439-11883_t